MASRDGIDNLGRPRGEIRGGTGKPAAQNPLCGSWEWNPESGEAVWSDEVYRIYGVEPRDAAPSPPAFNPRVFVEDRPVVEKALHAALEDGAPYVAEFRITRADGTVRRLRDEGAVSRRHGGKAANLTGIVRDITEPNDPALAVPAGGTSLEHAERIADMGVFAWNLETGHLRWSNRLFRMFGLDPETHDANHETLMSVVHPEDRERVKQVNKQETAGQLHPELEYRIVRPDGALRYLSERYEATMNAAGRPSVIRGIVQDVTERKMLEERFRHSHDVKVIGNLSGSIAHEFNNLLFVVLGNLELLEDCVSQDADILELIEAARRGATRGADLTERMLAFSRRQYLEPEKLFLNHLVPDLLPLLQKVVGDSVTIETRISNALRPVFADRGQVESALFHLASNARDALPSGGTVVLAVQNAVVGDQEAANFADAEAGSYVCLSMQDNGIGMAPDILENAAAPFFTTKDIGMGAGLGLSTIFGFASQSGGFAKAESRIGEGAKVSLYLPQAETDSKLAEAPGLEPEGAAILLVEEEPEVRELVSTFLRGLGYRVIEAGDGRAARAVLAGDERIDLLFADIAMPNGLAGPQLAEIGRQLRPGLKLLFMSGYREDFLVDSGQVMDGVPIIWKPYEKDEMARMVAEALGDSEET